MVVGFMVGDDASRVPVRFIIENVGELEGELVRFMAPRTVDAIIRRLPIEGRIALWKEEIYFEVPLKMGEEKSKSIVEKGTIAYWPRGNAICIFFGESQPYSPVNVIGKITGNLEMLRNVRSGVRIRLEIRR